MNDGATSEQGNLSSLELRLPPLPHTLPDILDLLDTPGLVDAQEMAEVVQRDPAVVARLLQQINSAYYGLRRSVTSVERAIRMMGPTAAAGAVIGLSMLKLQKLMEGPAGPCFTRLIRHSVGTAFLTRFLLGELPPQNAAPAGDASGNPSDNAAAFSSDGFTEGLLHDFGKIILVYNFPEKAVALYEEKSVGQQVVETDERALEQLVFGCDHTEAGAYAASTLHFPAPLVDVIRHHHAPEETPASRVLRAVRAANRAAKAMGRTFVGPRAAEAAPDWDACARDPIWAHWEVPSQQRERTARLMKALRAKKSDLTSYTKQFLAQPVAEAPRA